MSSNHGEHSTGIAGGTGGGGPHYYCRRPHTRQAWLAISGASELQRVTSVQWEKQTYHDAVLGKLWGKQKHFCVVTIDGLDGSSLDFQ